MWNWIRNATRSGSTDTREKWTTGEQPNGMTEKDSTLLTHHPFLLSAGKNVGISNCSVAWIPPGLARAKGIRPVDDVSAQSLAIQLPTGVGTSQRQRVPGRPGVTGGRLLTRPEHGLAVFPRSRPDSNAVVFCLAATAMTTQFWDLYQTRLAEHRELAVSAD